MIYSKKTRKKRLFLLKEITLFLLYKQSNYKLSIKKYLNKQNFVNLKSLIPILELSFQPCRSLLKNIWPDLFLKNSYLTLFFCKEENNLFYNFNSILSASVSFFVKFNNKCYVSISLKNSCCSYLLNYYLSIKVNYILLNSLLKKFIRNNVS